MRTSLKIIPHYKINICHSFYLPSEFSASRHIDFQEATSSHVTTSLPELGLEKNIKEQLTKLCFHFFSPALLPTVWLSVSFNSFCSTFGLPAAVFQLSAWVLKHASKQINGWIFFCFHGQSSSKPSHQLIHTHCGSSRASPKEGRFTWKDCRPGLEFDFLHTATLWAVGITGYFTLAARSSK